MGIQPTIEAANLGMADSLILMVLALVVFGPRRLPQIGRQIGKLMYEFRKASNDFKFQMEEELRNAEEADRRKKEEERIRALAAPAPPAAATETTPPPALPAAESAYPYESMYPPTSAPQAQSDGSPHGEDVPRIQPPSTGEQVAASRPNAVIASPEPEVSQSLENNNVDSSHDSGIRSIHEPVSDPYQTIESEPATPAAEPVDHHG